MVQEEIQEVTPSETKTKNCQSKTIYLISMLLEKTQWQSKNRHQPLEADSIKQTQIGPNKENQTYLIFNRLPRKNKEQNQVVEAHCFKERIATSHKSITFRDKVINQGFGLSYATTS